MDCSANAPKTDDEAFGACRAQTVAKRRLSDRIEDHIDAAAFGKMAYGIGKFTIVVKQCFSCPVFPDNFRLGFSAGCCVYGCAQTLPELYEHLPDTA